MNHFDWADLAFGSKKQLKELNATFITAPRDISEARLKQLIKQFLPKGNLVIGISKESHVVGLEDQPQFAMLDGGPVTRLIGQIVASKSPSKLYTLAYSQRELQHILDKVLFKHVILVNGSWHHTFHTLPAYYSLVNTNTSYEYVSAFTDEQEAHAYEKRLKSQLVQPAIELGAMCTDKDMLSIAEQAAKSSYDNGFQTGAALGIPKAGKYKLLAWGYNAVVPYQTHALLHGASREKHFSPPNDLNHYDTVHAEVMMILNVANKGIGLENTSLFINLLPCPACARMLSQTPIKEIVYQADHSEGYAVQLLEQSGKTVRRLVA